jgi:hypothetical protein
MKPNLVFKFRGYAQFSQGDLWLKYLKPDLIKLKDREAFSDIEPTNEFEAVKRDIKRSNSLRIINEIISLIERAENKLNKPYAKRIQADDA